MKRRLDLLLRGSAQSGAVAGAYALGFDPAKAPIPYTKREPIKPLEDIDGALIRE